MANVQGSWSISGTTATYTINGSVAAKVTGLPTGTTVKNSGNIDGIDVATDGDTGIGTIEFNASALQGSSKIAVTSSNGYSYTLDLASNVTKSEFQNITSTVSNGTLTINGDIPVGYKLAADGKSVSWISTAKVNQKLASVSGLNTGLKKTTTTDLVDGEDNKSTAISISGTNITLTEEALADKTVTLSLSNGSAYKLVASNIPEVSLVGSASVEFSGTTSKTATVKGDLSKGYIVADNKFTFQAAKNDAVLAKITGLGANASASNVTLGDSSKLGTTITVGKDALAKAASLTLSNGGAYTLAFDSSDTDYNQDGTLGFSEGKGNYWVTASNGTKATYKIDTDEGWAIDGNKINYTAAKTTTLATLSGLLKGTGDAETVATKDADPENTAGKIYDADAENDKPTIAGISVSGGVITLDNRVLGTTKVTIGAKENYTLDIDTTSTANKVDTTTAEKDLWAISGTTATFKTAAPTHYSKAADGKSIIYTATSKGDAAQATVKGLAKDLVVGTFDDVNKVYAVTTDETTGDVTKTLVMQITKAPVYENGTLTTPGEITLYKGADGTTNISVGAKEDYILVLDKSTEGNTAIAAPATSDEAWTYKNGVATLNAIYEEGGFTLAADSKTAVYTKPSAIKNGSQQSQKILEIKGLSKDLANTESAQADLTDYGITVTPIGEDDTGTYTVTIAASALSTGNVTITNANYKLDLATDVILSSDSKVKNGVDVWRINGTTAVYEKVIPAYYEYDATKNTVIYHKETVAKDSNNKDIVYATITGLDKNKLEAAYTHSETSEGVTSNIEGILISGKTITFTDPELCGSKVAIDAKKSQSGYKLVADETEFTKTALSADATPTWTVSGTTATLKGKTDAGWAVTDTTITKVAASNSAVLAVVKGLKSGLKANTKTDKDEDDNLIGDAGTKIGTVSGGVFTEAGIEVNGTEIVLDEDVLNKGEVTIESSAGYTLALGDVSKPEEDKTGWELDTSATNTNTAVLKQGTSAGYTLDEDGKIVYSAPNYTKNLTTITGLSKNTVLNDDNQLGLLDDDDNFTSVLIGDDGEHTEVKLVEVNADDKKITLNKAVLGDSDINSSTAIYKIKLTNEEGIEGNINQTSGTAWSIHNTSATLKNYTTKGYIGSGTDNITYKKDSYGTNILTLDGLKSGLSVNDDGELGVVDKKTGKFSKVATVGTVQNADEKYEITVEGDALDKKSDVTINNTNYALVLGSSAEQATLDEDNSGWKVPKAGQATYTEKTSAGYKVSEDGQTITYKSAGTSTTTINGLSSSLTQNTTFQDEISGIELKNGTVELSSSVLGTTNVTINSKDYVLAMGDLEEPEVAENGLTYKYNSKSGTVTLNGEIGEGWTLSSDSKTLLYTAATSGDPADLVTISGLAKGLSYEAEDNEAISGLVFDKTTNTITLGTAILGTANATLNQKNYKLALATTTPGYDGTAPAAETAWRINGTTATYKQVNPLYYTYDESKNTIVYHKETDVKNAVYATITGLDKTKLAEAYSNGAFTKGIDHSTANSTITLDEDILGAADVKLTTTGSYRLYLGSAVPTPTANLDKWENITEWQTTGTTANYKTYNKAYYTLASDGKSVKYTKPTTGSVAATITGIKKDVDINDCYNNRVITLGEDQLGTTNVKITKGAGYSLALAQGIKAPELDPNTVKFISADGKSKATLNGIVTAGYALTSDQQITYSAAKGTYADEEAGTDEKLAVLATISGLGLDGKDGHAEVAKGEEITSGIDLKMDGTAVALDDNGNATIIISDESLFADKDITVGKNEPYKLTFDATTLSDLIPTVGGKEWVANSKNNGTWTYQYNTSKGYTESTDGKTLKYSKAADTVLATVSGLIKNTDSKYIATSEEAEEADSSITGDSKNLYLVTVDEDNNETTVTPAVQLTENTTNEDGTQNADGKVELLSKDIFAGTKITVGKNENYKLHANAIAPEDFGTNPKWYVSGTKAELKSGKTSGYEADATGKNVTFVKEAPATAVATITGLGKGLVVSTGTEVASAVEGAENVTAGIVGTIAKVDMTDEDGDVIKDSKGKTTKVSVFTPGINVDQKKIGLNSNVLGTTNVSLDSDNGYYFTQQGVTTTSTGPALWTLKNGTATLKQTTNAGFDLNSTYDLFTYTPQKNDATLVTVSGLKKAELDGTSTDYSGLPANSLSNNISIDLSTNVITVKNGYLNAAKVTAKSGDKNVSYTLAMGSDVMQKNTEGRTNQTEWVTPVNGTTATYKTYDKGYYEYASVKGSEDQTTLNYVKETTGTSYATVSGLKKNAAIESFNAGTKVVTITEDMLDKKTLTLKGDAYTFAVGDNIAESLGVEYTDGDWSVASNGTATYKAVRTVDTDGGYMLSEDGKTFTYLKTTDKNAQAIITITGLNSTITSLSFNSTDDKIIELSESDLNKKTVKLTKGDGYTLALDDVQAASIESAAWSAVKSGKATLAGVINEDGAGYELAPDKKSVIYTAASAKDTKTDTYKNQNFATISGVKTTNTAITGTVSTATKTTSMKGADLTDKVTIGGTFGFNFESDYSNGSITGSSASDSVTVEGSGVSVNTAAGDDFVTFGSGGNNMFFYANGNGKDVIADFSSDDKINVTNVAITAENIKFDGNDVVIAIGKGSITLENYSDSITIYDKSKTATTYALDSGQYVASTASSNSYIADDNYIAPTQDLSAIVSKSSNSVFTVSDLNASQNLASLDKQSGFVAYSGDDK